MLIGSGMVIGSKAVAAGKPSKPKPSNVGLDGLDGPWSPALVHRAAPGSAAGVTAAPLGLWTTQAEDDGLCAAIFGGWSTPLCGLQDGPDASPGSEGAGAEGEVEGLQLSSKKKPKKKAGLGVADVIGISLSFLGACSLAAFMTTVQVSVRRGDLWCLPASGCVHARCSCRRLRTHRGVHLLAPSCSARAAW